MNRVVAHAFPACQLRRHPCRQEELRARMPAELAGKMPALRVLGFMGRMRVQVREVFPLLERVGRDSVES